MSMVLKGEDGKILALRATVHPSMRTASFLFVALVVALVVDGCGDDVVADSGASDAGADARSDGTAEGPRVELGTGVANFVEIPVTDPEMELIAGPQGGWHLNVSARLYDLTIPDLLLTYRAEQDGVTVAGPVVFLLSERRLVRDGERWLRQGDQLIFAITGPADVVGERVDVIVLAEPTDGPAVSDRRTGVLVVDVEP
jgi:hypothetical protein